MKAETAWRTSRVIHTREIRDESAVADTAIAWARAIQQGTHRWEEEAEGTRGWQRLRNTMNWN